MTEIELEPGTVPLREAAYRRLRDDIITCRLAPGQRLTERGLSTETDFGVSSIREALTRLDHEGLVRTIPRKGYQVKPLTLKGVDDLFEFWEIIGPELVRRGLVNGTAAQRAEMIAGFDEMYQLNEAEHTRENVTRSIELSQRTFKVIAESTHNEYLVTTYQRLSDELSRVWALMITADTVQQMPVALPDDWREAITNRDGAVLGAYISQYIQQVRGQVQRTLMRWPSVVATEVVPLHRVD
jgi:DNA-binding GntR family transcriptional regulator